MSAKTQLIRPHALVVGDPHLQVQKLDDAKEFIEKISVLALSHEKVILLGDQFHSFAVIRSEILQIWAEFFIKFGKKVISLVGNHDFAGQSGGSHALAPFKDMIHVVDDYIYLMPGVAFFPFFRDKEIFKKNCENIKPGDLLICHQSFQGAQFQNGFYDPDGVDLDCVAHLRGVISGHVHSTQTLGNVWYPGTPFQHSFGEAGQKKRVYSIDLSPPKYSVLEEHDLKMPEYIQIEAATPALLLDVLPSVNLRHQYKLVSKGSPAEIASFWKDERARNFRSGARRVVDGMIPDRGEVGPVSPVGSKREKIEHFIRQQKWRTDPDTLIAKAAEFF